MDKLTTTLYDELRRIPLIDPHTHVNALDPASHRLDDLLGYHYYTELAHSAGMDKALLDPALPSQQRMRSLADHLPLIENTLQYSWLLEIARTLLGFDGERIDAGNVEDVSAAASACMAERDWEEQVLRAGNIEKVFLTNEFDDALTGFDAGRYVPCLRTDSLVFRLNDTEVMARLNKSSGVQVGDTGSLRRAIAALFERFVKAGARAAAISLPPSFQPFPERDESAGPMLAKFLDGQEMTSYEVRSVHRFIFWTVAEFCRDYRLPFDLMIGVNRGVYEDGVPGGTDLFNHLTSLHQYQRLFNAFPTVTFPVSVLDGGQNQELASYAWIFPNVVTSGHWWYANIAPTIDRDLRQRINAVARTKQIGYYSDAYKLEFIAPKFNMYRRVLAAVLADDFVIARGWSEEKAVELGYDLLRRNVERIFFGRES
ncbi:MAG: Uronate isomerase [Phycisphaerae bacterium]|nr:Uronate isomerase [Phycisphaerae bacterium]